MTVNLSIRNYSITIGGLDCTTALMEFSGSDSKLDQSGVVTFSGTLKLGRPVGFESLDDRVNNRWALGAPIVVQIADLSNTLIRPSRFGTLFILDALFNRTENDGAGSLDIKVGDILSLLANKEASEDNKKPKVCTHDGGISAQSAINQLLGFAGVPVANQVTDPIPGIVAAPANGGGSYIAQAGKIAASQGWFLYVDGVTGNVRAREISVDSTQVPLNTLSVSNSTSEFGRLPDRPPAQKVKVSGSGKIVTPMPRQGTLTISRQYGNSVSLGGSSAPSGAVLIRERRTSETINGNVRTLSVEVSEARGAIWPENPAFAGQSALTLSETYTEVHTYESASPVVAGSSACETGNQGRLLRSVITSRKVFCKVFRGLFANNKTAPMVPAITFSEGDWLNLVDESTETITYEYLSTVSTDATQLGKGPIVRRIKKQPLGAILPDYFRKDSYRPIYSQNYGMMVDTESEYNYWAQTSASEWQHERNFQQSQISADPAQVARTHEYYKKEGIVCDAQFYAGLITVDETSGQSSSQNQPPAPDTLPPAFEVTDTETEVEYQLPVDGNWQFRPPAETYNFDLVGGTNKADLNARALNLATIWGTVAWGRYKGSVASFAFDDFLLGQYRPNDKIAVDEQTYVSKNIADGFSVAMAEGELMGSLDLIYLGFTVV
ncbi:MAG: hypothetical protein ACRC62_12375, partial [Microcoleus sp.]